MRPQGDSYSDVWPNSFVTHILRALVTHILRARSEGARVLCGGGRPRYVSSWNYDHSSSSWHIHWGRCARLGHIFWAVVVALQMRFARNVSSWNHDHVLSSWDIYWGCSACEGAHILSGDGRICRCASQGTCVGVIMIIHQVRDTYIEGTRHEGAHIFCMVVVALQMRLPKYVNVWYYIWYRVRDKCIEVAEHEGAQNEHVFCGVMVTSCSCASQGTRVREVEIIRGICGTYIMNRVSHTGTIWRQLWLHTRHVTQMKVPDLI